MRQPISERRHDIRQRSLLGARIEIAPEASTTECLVRNIGPGGARILLSDAVPLPETFDLVVTARREICRARLVWRRDDMVGVAFVKPRPPVAPIPLDLMRELHASRAENAALRLRLADLKRQPDADRSC